MTLKIEERQALIKHRLKRARETQLEANFLFQNNMYLAAVNRIYYSMFHALSALALHHGFQSNKHGRLISWFNNNFVKTEIIDTHYSKILIRSFEKRMDSDYDDFIEFAHEEVKSMLKDCEDFISLIEKMSTTDRLT